MTSVSLDERVTHLELDVLALQHADREQAGRLDELRIQLVASHQTSDAIMAAVGELAQDMHGVDARVAVLERDVAQLKGDVAEVKGTLAEHGELLRLILDRLPAPDED